MRLHPVPISIAAGAALAGCEGPQSVLSPHGTSASEIATLSWIMFAGGGIVLLLVVGLTAFAVLAPRDRRQWLAGKRFIISLGIVFPLATLSVLLVYGLLLTGTTARGDGTPAFRIGVVGEQFWWRIAYPGEDGRNGFAAANEIVIPVGVAVELTLAAKDVIHSFWVPSLAGKLDMVPGHTNRLVIVAERPGVYRGQCAEYCGAQHARMAFEVLAYEREEFEQWLARQREPAAAPSGGPASRGRDLFLATGCGGCHAIRGTPAAGTIAPDLTHVGSRRMIGAGMLPNDAETLARWIAGTQHMKPGNRMPSFDALPREELSAIAAYLESLK